MSHPFLFYVEGGDATKQTGEKVNKKLEMEKKRDGKKKKKEGTEIK